MGLAIAILRVQVIELRLHFGDPLKLHVEYLADLDNRGFDEGEPIVFRIGDSRAALAVQSMPAKYWRGLVHGPTRD